MTYNKAIEYIHSKAVFGSRPGLSRISRLCSLMGNPQKETRFVHVAGTNGKGSVTAFLASVLSSAGYKTGRYISPYIECFNERISINGKYISDKELADITEKVMIHAENMAKEDESPTEFEIITAIAFEYFRQNKCDIAVLETGLGGRLDATNIIDAPLCAAITKISYDHKDILGDSLDKIAYEKCGIIKPGSTVISYPEQQPVVRLTIVKTAKQYKSPLYAADITQLSDVTSTLFGTKFNYKNENYSLKLLGKHQSLNAVTAIETVESLRKLGFNISQNALYNGLYETFFPARLEVLSHNPTVIFDGAHNPDGIDSLIKAADDIFGKTKISVVMGMLKDKDYIYCAKKLAKTFENLFTVEPDNPRALSADELAAAASPYGAVRSFGRNYKGALTAAKTAAGKDGAVIICGSLYLATDVRKLFSKKGRI